jgi:hypothetical protein
MYPSNPASSRSGTYDMLRRILIIPIFKNRCPIFKNPVSPIFKNPIKRVPKLAPFFVFPPFIKILVPIFKNLVPIL